MQHPVRLHFLAAGAKAMDRADSRNNKAEIVLKKTSELQKLH